MNTSGGKCGGGGGKRTAGGGNKGKPGEAHCRRRSAAEKGRESNELGRSGTEGESRPRKQGENTESQIRGGEGIGGGGESKGFKSRREKKEGFSPGSITAPRPGPGVKNFWYEEKK